MTQRVLSIQSHVTRGCVGNRAFATALRLQDYEADEIHTVNFSATFVHEGSRLEASQFQTLADGLVRAVAQDLGLESQSDLEAEWEHDYPICVTGFAGSADLLQALCDFARDRLLPAPCRSKFTDRIGQYLALRSQTGAPHDGTDEIVRARDRGAKGRCIMIMDPVLGDNGVFYAGDRNLTDTYIKNLLLADILTPNEYELNLLLAHIRRSSAHSLTQSGSNSNQKLLPSSSTLISALSPGPSDPPVSEREVCEKVRFLQEIGGLPMVFLTSADVPETQQLLSVLSVKRPVQTALAGLDGMYDEGTLFLLKLPKRKPETAHYEEITFSCQRPSRSNVGVPLAGCGDVTTAALTASLLNAVGSSELNLGGSCQTKSDSRESKSEAAFDRFDCFWKKILLETQLFMQRLLEAQPTPGTRHLDLLAAARVMRGVGRSSINLPDFAFECASLSWADFTLGKAFAFKPVRSRLQWDAEHPTVNGS